MSILILSPRAIPPWDSAIASLSRSRLKSLASLTRHLTLVTCYRDYNSIQQLHENIVTNSIYLDYFNELRRYSVTTYFVKVDPDTEYNKAITRLVLATKTLDSIVLWNIGIPLHVIIPLCKPSTCIHELITIEQKDSPLLTVLSKVKHIVFTSTSYTRYTKLSSKGVRLAYIPPAIDTEVYRRTKCTLNNYFQTVCDLRILYMGPLLSDRFPLTILRAMKTLVDEGYNICLLVVSTIRSKRSLTYYGRLQRLIRELGLEKYVKIKRKVLLSDHEKVQTYSCFDVLLYTPIKGVEMSDPPLTVLEALSIGLPVIASPIGDLKYLARLGGGLLVNPLNYTSLVESIKGIHDGLEEYSVRAVKIVDNYFSHKVVDKRINMLLEYLGGIVD